MCLLVAMVFTMLPVQAFATDGQTQTTMETGDVTVQGTNGFGTLLSQEIHEYCCYRHKFYKRQFL